MMDRSRAPSSENCKVRGIGVAVRVRVSTECFIWRSFSLAVTPNFCSSSMMRRPKSLNSTIHVIASDIDYGENLVVRAVVNEDATGTVKFTVNGEDKTVDVHHGFASATFTNVNAGNYVVKAVYSGDEVYLSSSNTTSVRVNKVNSTIAIKVGETGKITVTSGPSSFTVKSVQPDTQHFPIPLATTAAWDVIPPCIVSVTV